MGVGRTGGLGGPTAPGRRRSRAGVPGAAVPVIHNGKVVHVKGYGMREVGTDKKVDASSVDSDYLAAPNHAVDD